MPNKPKLCESDKFMSAEDTEKLLAVARKRMAENRKSLAAERNYLIVVVALNAGLRASEIVALHVGDLRLSDTPPRLIVRGGKGRKAGKRRQTDDVDEVALTFQVAKLLKRWTQDTAPEEPVFPTERLRDGMRVPLSRIGVWQAVKSMMREAGLNPKFGVHTLRHRFVMTEIEAEHAQGEVDPYLVSRRARHRGIQQTMTYFHMDPKRVERHIESRKDEI